MIRKLAYILLISLPAVTAMGQGIYHEQYRPQIHFSPPAHWMNDPNGMVYYKGVYHLFYQYYPGATVWGPMHWGHATSPDMVHWTNKPVAIYPDTIGLIFSGSVVVDYQNTSGFGKNGQPPLIAIFTQHSQEKEKAGRVDAQVQSIAYSNDDGKTWKKYTHNPVIKNPGIADFRDPKVMWYAPEKKWVMTLATKDRITFFSSPNLKDWKKESEFGATLGAHGGVWECPDLFPMTAADGKKMWVLIVNINPGGPQGGSATQYFTGSFDGKTFTPNNTTTRFLDQGTDEYAGVTWSNTGNRRLFLGWMSNWNYAITVPTKVWRSAMTVPRELRLTKVGDDYYVAAEPVKEMAAIKSKTLKLPQIRGNGYLNKLIGRYDNQYQLNLSSKNLRSFSVDFSNDKHERLTAGFDAKKNVWYIDRTQAGESGFNKDFAKRIEAPRIAKESNTDVTLIIDAASIELFADKGLTVMTAIFFPEKPLNKIGLIIGDIASPPRFSPDKVTYTPLTSIWPKK